MVQDWRGGPKRAQLRARGGARRSVGERKKEWRLVERSRRICKGNRGGPYRRRIEHGLSSGGRDRSPSGAAITDAAALFRVAVALLLMVRMLSRRCRRHGAVMPGSRGVTGDIDRQATVHDAGMQLHRRHHTDGEPDRRDTGESAEERFAGHGSNIGCATIQGSAGPARAIRPSAAISVSSVSGTHSTSHCTVV
jgi:hypothetical protein